MPNHKHKRGPFRIQNNTDGVDIRDKCLGLDAWLVGDSVSTLNSNRGLHIQIRHNQDEATFEAANDLANLIASAPELLDALELARNFIHQREKYDEREVMHTIVEALNKARGGSNE